MFNIRRRTFVIGGVIAVGAAAAAFAYFTATGSGTGEATVGNSTPVTLNGTVAQALYPETSSSVSFTVDNPSDGNQRVGTISLVSITPDSGHSSCSTSI